MKKKVILMQFNQNNNINNREIKNFTSMTS